MQYRADNCMRTVNSSTLFAHVSDVTRSYTVDMEEVGDACEEVLDQLPVVVAPVLGISVADGST